jgi:hypothetical protein
MKEEIKTIVDKGAWKSINKLKDLQRCPICDDYKLVSYKSSKTRSHKSCGCGCKIYETKDKLWFTIPDQKIEIVSDTSKLEKYMDLSKN